MTKSFHNGRPIHLLETIDDQHYRACYIDADGNDDDETGAFVVRLDEIHTEAQKGSAE